MHTASPATNNSAPGAPHQLFQGYETRWPSDYLPLLFETLARHSDINARDWHQLAAEIRRNSENIAAKFQKHCPDGSRLPIPESLMLPERAAFFIQLVKEHLKNLCDKEKLCLLGAVILLSKTRNDIHKWKHLFEVLGTIQFLDEAAAYCDVSRLAFAVGIGRTYDVFPEYCFHAFPKRIGTNVFMGALQTKDFFPTFTCGDETFISSGQYPFPGFNGAVSQVVFRFIGKERNLFAFASRMAPESGQMAFGCNAPCASLYNFPTIANNPTKHVLLIINQDVLASILDFVACAVEPTRFDAIVSGTFGGVPSLDAYDLTPLHGHSVTIVCSPARNEYEKINSLAKRCHKNGATEVTIYPYPIKGKHCWFGSGTLPANINSALEGNVIDLDEQDQVQKLIEHIRDQAIPASKLESWEIKIGLREDKGISKASAISEISAVSWNYDDGSSICDALETLTDLFPCDDSTLIYGPSGCAKSTFAIQCAMSLALGQGFMGLAGSRPQKGLYVDAEMRGHFRKRVKQLLPSPTEEQKELLLDNLLLLHRESHKAFKNHFDKTIEFIDTNRLKFIVLDNIISLMPVAWRKSDQYDEFIDGIKSAGAHPFSIHHTGKDNEILGTSTLIAKSQSVFRIDDAKAEICKILESKNTGEFEVIVPESVLFEARDRPGNCIKLTLEKTKTAPYWERKSIFMWLPAYGTWRQLTAWPKAAPDHAPCSESSSLGDPDLPPDMKMRTNELTRQQLDVLMFIAAYKRGVQRSEIDQAFHWCASTSRRILTTLLDEGFIIRLGGSRGTTYQLKF